MGSGHKGRNLSSTVWLNDANCIKLDLHSCLILLSGNESYKGHLSLKIGPDPSRLHVLTRWMLRQRRIPLELEFIVQGEAI
jgi:hypothetical protein